MSNAHRKFRVTQVATGLKVTKSYSEISRTISGNPVADKVREVLKAGEVWEGTDYRIEPLDGIEALQETADRWFGQG